jgi:hypothetical protein
VAEFDWGGTDDGIMSAMRVVLGYEPEGLCAGESDHE